MSRVGQVFVVLAVFACLYWIASGLERNGDSRREHTQVAEQKFHGYDCTVDCSGHEAGYDWAEKQEIADGDDCDTAGEHSNSPSFAEGCHAYVDGDDKPQPEDVDGPISSGEEQEAKIILFGLFKEVRIFFRSNFRERAMA